MEETDGLDGAIYRRLGVRVDLDDTAIGHIDVTPAVCAHGRVRPSILMFVADAVVGMRIEEATPDWSFTTDFSIRTAAPAGLGTVFAETEVLRHGRRLMVEEITFRDAQGTEVAYAQVTFIRVDAPDGIPKPDISAARRTMAAMHADPLEVPIPEAAGIVVLDGGTGHAEMRPTDAVRRPGGFVQGAMLTLLGEVSAQALAEAHHGRPCVVADMDVRYLLGGRTGPLVARAEWVGNPERGNIRVIVRDHGHNQAITTPFLCRVDVL